MSVGMISFYSFVTGVGSCAAFQAALKTATLNWPTHRGSATAFPLAAFGLSAFFYTLIAGIAFVVYMNVENHVIQPAIVGRSVDLTAPTTMVAAFVGGAVAGVPGALVATPLVGAAKAIYLEARGVDSVIDDERPPLRQRLAQVARKLTGRFRRHRSRSGR